MSDDRSQLPTPKRRQLARTEGRVAASRQVTAAMLWLVASIAFVSLGNACLKIFKQSFVDLWTPPDASGVASPTEILMTAMVMAGRILVPTLAVVFGIAIVSRIAQFGFVWSPQRVIPKWDRVSPASRSLEVFSFDKFFEAFRGALLIATILGIMGYGIWTNREALLQLAYAPLAHMESRLSESFGQVAIQLGLCLAVFAAMDYACQRYRFEMSLRMTPEEMRAEVQAVQGNPQVAAGRRETQREIRQRNAQ